MSDKICTWPSGEKTVSAITGSDRADHGKVEDGHLGRMILTC